MDALSLFLKILFIHERHTERQRHRQKEKQAPCREPDVGLDPRSLGPHPGPKADAQPLSHPGIPRSQVFKYIAGRMLGRTAGKDNVVLSDDIGYTA